MATIKKTLSKKINGNGNSEILFRVTVNHFVQIRVKTGIYISAKRWNEQKGIVLPRVGGFEYDDCTKKKDLLSALESRVIKICEIVPAEQINSNWMEEVLILCADVELSKLSPDIIRQKQDEKNNPDQYVKKSFFEWMETYLQKKQLSISQTKNFRVLIRALCRYESFIKLTDPDRPGFAFDIDTVDKETIEDVIDYLSNEHTLMIEYPDEFKKILNDFPNIICVSRKVQKIEERGTNTITKFKKNFKAFYNWCNQQGITKNRPFDGITIGSEVYGTPYYLTLQERNKVADFDLSGRPALETQRDIFIFQCLIGCRVSDLLKLTDANIINEAVEYIPSKTKGEHPTVVRVPLNDRAKHLIQKYVGKGQAGKLFPFISSQKYNEDIKEFLKVCGITRMVTILNPTTGNEEKRPINEVASSHMARRTFVGNLYKQVKDPNLICPLSGHTEGSKAFARYREIDEDLKKEIVSLIN